MVKEVVHKEMLLIIMMAVIIAMISSMCRATVFDQDQTSVTLSIDPWASANINCGPEGIIMTTVTFSWFGHNYRTSGAALVDLSTNDAIVLRTLTSTTLIGELHGLAYDADVDITLHNNNSGAYYNGDYICLNFSPGTYLDQTTLEISIRKLWGTDDLADTYRGTVTVELVSQLP